MSDLLTIANRLAQLMQLDNCRVYSLLNAATNRRWIATGYDISQAFFENGSSQNSRRGGTVASQVARLLRDFDN